MDNQQQVQRQAAADAFIKSLDQLADCFETELKPPAAESLTQSEQDSNLQTVQESQLDLVDLEDLAAAAADLEQFLSPDS